MTCEYPPQVLRGRWFSYSRLRTSEVREALVSFLVCVQGPVGSRDGRQTPVTVACQRLCLPSACLHGQDLSFSPFSIPFLP